jgi:catechol 2,3-dioxygenase-like lactoylglutathione lyase family enzyme
MSETTPVHAGRATIPALYHPTIAVHDLDAARDWFRRVFSRVPLRWEQTLDLDLLEPDYPTNYSFFAFVADIHWVFLCPELHARGSLTGQTRYRDVAEGMIGLGWYTDDAVELFARLADAGIRSHDQKGRLIAPDAPPVSSFARDVLTGFTEPADTGIRYEFQETGRRHWEFYSRDADPRLRPDWDGPRLDPADPLGILLTSHHTIVTVDPTRVLDLYVGLLDGEIVARSRDDTQGMTSTFVRLADTVLEFAVPDAGSPEAEAVAQGRDRYVGVTLQVADVEAAGRHLAEVGVETAPTAGGVAIPPAAGFGAEWRFVAELPYPAGVRRRPAF